MSGEDQPEYGNVKCFNINQKLNNFRFDTYEDSDSDSNLSFKEEDFGGEMQSENFPEGPEDVDGDYEEDPTEYEEPPSERNDLQNEILARKGNLNKIFPRGQLSSNAPLGASSQGPLGGAAPLSNIRAKLLSLQSQNPTHPGGAGSNFNNHGNVSSHANFSGSSPFRNPTPPVHRQFRPGFQNQFGQNQNYNHQSVSQPNHFPQVSNIPPNPSNFFPNVSQNQNVHDSDRPSHGDHESQFPGPRASSPNVSISNTSNHNWQIQSNTTSAPSSTHELNKTHNFVSTPHHGYPVTSSIPSHNTQYRFSTPAQNVQNQFANNDPRVQTPSTVASNSYTQPSPRFPGTQPFIRGFQGQGISNNGTAKPRLPVNPKPRFDKPASGIDNSNKTFISEANKPTQFGIPGAPRHSRPYSGNPNQTGTPPHSPQLRPRFGVPGLQTPNRPYSGNSNESNATSQLRQVRPQFGNPGAPRPPRPYTRNSIETNAPTHLQQVRPQFGNPGAPQPPRPFSGNYNETNAPNQPPQVRPQFGNPGAPIPPRPYSGNSTETNSAPQPQQVRPQFGILGAPRPPHPFSGSSNESTTASQQVRPPFGIPGAPRPPRPFSGNSNESTTAPQQVRPPFGIPGSPKPHHPFSSNPNDTSTSNESQQFVPQFRLPGANTSHRPYSGNSNETNTRPQLRHVRPQFGNPGAPRPPHQYSANPSPSPNTKFPDNSQSVPLTTTHSSAQPQIRPIIPQNAGNNTPGVNHAHLPNLGQTGDQNSAGKNKFNKFLPNPIFSGNNVRTPNKNILNAYQPNHNPSNQLSQNANSNVQIRMFAPNPSSKPEQDKGLDKPVNTQNNAGENLKPMHLNFLNERFKSPNLNNQSQFHPSSTNQQPTGFDPNSSSIQNTNLTRTAKVLPYQVNSQTSPRATSPARSPSPMNQSPFQPIPHHSFATPPIPPPPLSTSPRFKSHAGGKEKLTLENGEEVDMIEVYKSLIKEDYFFAIPKTTVMNYLREGTFLLRPSSQRSEAQPVSLCLMHNGKPFTFAINKRSDNSYSIGKEKPGEERFGSIQELISYYQANLFQFQGMVVYLSHPAQRT